jgi:hypothetical protein
MRRAILLLAAVVAGASGCSNECNYGGTLTIYWQPPQGGFVTSSGDLLGCDDAGVSTVDVTINGSLVDTFNCHASQNADGIQLTGFGDETVNVQLDAYSSSNEHLYQAVTSTTTTYCASRVLDVKLSSLKAEMNVAYSFTSGSGGCVTPSTNAYSTTFIWYRLVDSNGTLVSAANSSQNATAIPCSANRTFTVQDLPLNKYYAVNGIEEVELFADGTYIVWRYNCNQSPSVLHSQAGDTVTADTMVVQAAGGRYQCF